MVYGTCSRHLIRRRKQFIFRGEMYRESHVAVNHEREVWSHRFPYLFYLFDVGAHAGVAVCRAVPVRYTESIRMNAVQK